MLCQLWLLSVTLLAAGSQRVSAAASTNVNMENDILHFSFELERWLDADKRPCQDFYAFVCSKAINSTQEQLAERQQQEQQKFDKFLTHNDDEQLLDAELKLKQFYESCKNARSLEELKSSLMYRLSGGWPAIDDSALMIRRRRNMTWMDVLGAFHDIGLNYFFLQHIEIKSNKRVVYLQPDDATRYTLRKFEQLAGEVMQEYAVEAGKARLIALEILNFERNRREIIKAESGAGDGDVEYAYADFKDSKFGRTLQIDWDAYFKKTLGKPLRTTDTVVVYKEPKLMQIFDLLQNTTMTRLLNWIWIDYLMDKSSSNCQKLIQHYFEPIYQHIVQHASINKTQMAQMYSEIGRAYEELLPPSSWIDEMSQQNTKQFLGRVIHLTLNGDAKLDSDYAQLQITKRNFFRNLEKAQRFLSEQRPIARVAGDTLEAAKQLTTDFMQVFMAISALLQQQNLTTPINYALVGEHFAEHLIRGGSSSPTPGAWRSMESEREFATLKQCVAQQQPQQGIATYNVNDLLLKLLAQQLALQTFEQWQQKEAALVRRVDTLLASGRLQLSVRKLYFIGSVWAECRQYGDVAQKALVHSYLRNSPKFRQAFKCRAGDELYARIACKVL